MQSVIWKSLCYRNQRTAFRSTIQGRLYQRVTQKWPLPASSCVVLKKWKSPRNGKNEFWGVRWSLTSSYSLPQTPISFPLNRGKETKKHYFREKEREVEGEGGKHQHEKHRSVASHMHPSWGLGITQAGALTGNQTHEILLCGIMPNCLGHGSQGKEEETFYNTFTITTPSAHLPWVLTMGQVLC